MQICILSDCHRNLNLQSWIVGKTRKIDLGFGNSASRVVIALLKATIQETPGALVVACTESRRSTSGERNHLEWNVLRLKRNLSRHLQELKHFNTFTFNNNT